MDYTGDDYTLLWTVLAAVTMVVGLLGVAIPVLPGLALIWGVALVYGLLVGFGTVGVVVMVVLTIVVAISFIKSLILPKRAAANSGASGWAQLGAVGGAIVGFFFLPLVGVILGALAGMALVEYLLKGNWGEAWVATKGTAKGFGLSTLIDFGLGMFMIAAWTVWAGFALLS